MTSKLPKEKYSQENSQIMFQICVFSKNVQGKEPMWHPETFFKMKWLWISKYTIFLILLKIQDI
jgi:hypothetical protein